MARNLIRALPKPSTTTPWLNIGIMVQLSLDPEIVGNRVFYATTGLYSGAVDTGLFLENRIRHSQLRGISADSGTTDSDFVRNIASGGLDIGILMLAGTSNNLLLENDARNNIGLDCSDQTAGPANIWIDNLGAKPPPSARSPTNLFSGPDTASDPVMSGAEVADTSTSANG